MREPETPRQLPLDLGHTPGFSRDDLVVSQANAQAVALVDRWPDWPAPVVVLAGPAGAGKTHLASIWRNMSAAVTLKGTDIETHLPTLDATRPVLIDDADLGPLDQNGLFHLINQIRGAGSFLLLTARRFPSAWGVTLPDLASRLKAAATVEIDEPDDLLLAGVITKLFADRQVEVDPAVVQYLVRRIERSLSTAMSVVARLDQAGLEQKTRITRALAGEILNAMDEGQGEFDL
ncbi:regulatory inactivation of DnaA Hda protein [Pseudaminobacter salicylatoxidans]|uniref:Regulatory inactivation of DnaA Hda protein n=1 Tax=Pseudaminobacter salicylatoxidans TaxID=93369 RepID=A0A316C623_PSESE|nr:DnaA regulatory inactivator HdaA [Pseudaminobacter salicylatoxidans]PWJ85180.1 regulatory inactivation of DnaA Hda protein [Pseudaminobacter salicylatoxidans]